MEHKKKYEVVPTTIPIIPTIDVVVFPYMVVPLLVLDEKIIAGINHALEHDKKILLLAAQERSENYKKPISINDLYSVGTVANIIRVMSLPDGGIKILTQGLMRARVEEILTDADILSAQTTPLYFQEYSDPNFSYEHLDEVIKNISSLVEKLGASGRIFSPDFQTILSQIHEPERIADFVLSHINISVHDAQNLLERESLFDLFTGIYGYLASQAECSDLDERIRVTTRESINKSQREYYLREQMRAIQKELGDEQENEIDELRSLILKKKLPEEARTEAERQIKRLEKTTPESMEATVIRNHLEWLLDLPWQEFSTDSINIDQAKAILDEAHFGLEKIKDRILDFLSIKKLNKNCNMPILCLVGPPGVGKTSLGQSIAKCMGRSFFRFSVGGIHDESEIRGHRRTYVGALPGRFIQAIRKAKTSNPIIVIDEIDKVGHDGKSDPSAALLEVLDPEQNINFYDNYLGVHFDLSKVIFITTANDISTIPAPLRDRMEIIQVSGYTLEEKMEISRRYLLHRSIKNAGLDNKGFELSNDVLQEVIAGYTRESGVRDLERIIQTLCSKYARSLVEMNEKIIFTPDTISHFLGPRKIPLESLSHKHRVGVTNGLAWTPYGGEILQVEAVLTPGKGRLILTGQLGEVMKESAQAALTFAKHHAEFFKIPAHAFTKQDFHIHLPAGAIPKDGPSAGVTLLSSILSALTGRHINGTYAMTGELNLQGNVLAIGGVKEKILAAKQRGLHNIILPRSNQKDLEELGDLSQGMNIYFVDEAKEVLEHVLLPLSQQEAKPE